MKSLILYSYFWKFLEALTSTSEDLKSKVAKLKAKNAKLKENSAKQDKELLLLGHQHSMTQAVASEAMVARVEVKAKADKLSAKVEEL